MGQVKRTAILVPGMHRSGTSAMARTLNLFGAQLPDNLLAPGREENPTGFWESEDFLKCHERFLREVGSGWDDPLPLPAAAFTGEAAQLAHDEIVAHLHRNFGQTALFAVKDPRLCRLMPLWERALDSFGATKLAVVPVRNPLDVALSLRNRNGFSREAALALWFIHALQAERATRGMRRVFTLYDDFISKPGDAAASLADRLGCFSATQIKRGLADIQDYWRDTLRHHALGAEALRNDATVPIWVRTLYDWLEAAAQGRSPATADVDVIAQALEPALQLYGPLIAAQRPLKEQIADMRVAAQASSEILAGARAETAHAAGERDNMRIERDALRGEASDLRLETERWRGKSRLIGLDLARLRQELRGRLSEIESLRRERLQQEEGRAGLERRLGEAGEKIAALQEQRDLAAAQAEAARLEATAARDEVEAARIEAASIRADASASRGEAERLRDEAGRMRQESEGWRKKAVSSDGRNAALRQQNKVLSAELRRGELAHAALADERDHWRIRSEELSHSLDAEIARQERLSGELAEIRREHGQSSRDLAAVRRQADEIHDLLYRALRRRRWSDRVAPVKSLRGLAEAAWLWPWLRGFFDRDHYRRIRPPGAAWLSDLAHYLLVGRAKDLSPTPLFDPAYYRRRYPDVALSGADPLLHYMRHGGREGRKPSPGFDGAHYLRQNPDVARSGANPLRHYLRHGWREGRNPNALFDVSFYRQQSGWAAEPLTHYLARAQADGYRPSRAFDPGRYLEENPDVAALGLDPLLHYLENGRAEGRSLPVDGVQSVRDEPKRAGLRILMVTHGLGGGTDHHCRDMEALLTAEGVDVWILQGAADRLFRLENVRRAIVAPHDLAVPGGEAALLADLRHLSFDLVHVHHTIGFGRLLEKWLADLALPYDVTLHDYTAICPRVTLLDDRHLYCGAPLDTARCDRCVGGGGLHPFVQNDYAEMGDVAHWRATFRDFLAGARALYVPDQDVADRLAEHFPDFVISVRPHPDPISSVPARPPPGGPRVRVAMIGGIGDYKGFDLLVACARAASRDALPLTFVVIGELSKPAAATGLPAIELRGTYRREDLPDILDGAGCHLALFLSRGPETYMYTLSEALRAGLYPVVSDLGAPARRIRELGWGRVIPMDLAPEEINRLLLDLATDHPLPASDLRFGKVYASLIADYYGLDPS